ncbi:MAG: hypothetical protein A3H70_03230 [Candidatus Komeilibacteria bacterium RIFCSPLOWO2_02_FULL_48_11]|uniref:Thioredoxin domain-containing protein n=1 Tax=Candidatus Komeilibacteria bacterium RIFCSPLOWO2_02_FULL_48_11 TaxID=1798553 RepID=A0A1G2BTB5_9BACT|nr:MAG: hypothetical protein A3H70_03230 [Candidatus Komeilibacteria bacterium RIFCSPLOWO2_02_FULL_48_11]
MSHKHNISIFFLLALGIIIIIFFGVSTVRDRQARVAKNNPFEGIARPQFYSESPNEGEDSASLVLFEYGDFACPACREMHPVVERIFAAYGDRVLHVWKDFPLHPGFSQGAAVAARCADKQGKFWPYHDLLFSKQVELGEIDLTKAAQSLNLDLDKFSSCLKDQAVAELAQRDFLEGQALGVNLTPTFVIGDQAFSGVVSFEDFESIVLAELAKL